MGVLHQALNTVQKMEYTKMMAFFPAGTLHLQPLTGFNDFFLVPDYAARGNNYAGLYCIFVCMQCRFLFD